MKPLVSVVIAAYNVEQYIGQSLRSVREQTSDPSDLEIVIYDDGSIDRTLGAIRREASEMPDHTLHVHSGENRGTASARNHAILRSRGKFIIPLDADDLLETNAVESTLRFMQNHPQVAFSYSQHRRIDEEGNTLCTRPGHHYTRERLLHYNFIGHLKCFSRELFDQLGGFDSSVYVEDYDFVLRASEILCEDQITHNPELLYRYRVYGGNKSSKGEKVRVSAAKVIQASLKRKEGIEAGVQFSHMTEEQYNYFKWRETR